MINEKQALKTGEAKVQIDDNKKLSKEDLERKLKEMEERAKQIEQEREHRYNTVLKVNETREDENKAKDGIQPKFVKSLQQQAYVDHNMDLSDRINMKKHYNQRVDE